jgi:hypothetical protein
MTFPATERRRVPVNNEGPVDFSYLAGPSTRLLWVEERTTPGDPWVSGLVGISPPPNNQSAIQNF